MKQHPEQGRVYTIKKSAELYALEYGGDVKHYRRQIEDLIESGEITIQPDSIPRKIYESDLLRFRVVSGDVARRLVECDKQPDKKNRGNIKDLLIALFMKGLGKFGSKFSHHGRQSQIIKWLQKIGDSEGVDRGLSEGNIQPVLKRAESILKERKKLDGT